MKTVGFRSIVLYLLLFAFLGGTGYLVVNLFLHGNQWAMQPYNGHIYAESSTVKMGDIKDRNGNLLATTEDGRRLYSESETVRRALMHTIGDPYGYVRPAWNTPCVRSWRATMLSRASTIRF